MVITNRTLIKLARANPGFRRGLIRRLQRKQASEAVYYLFDNLISKRDRRVVQDRCSVNRELRQKLSQVEAKMLDAMERTGLAEAIAGYKDLTSLNFALTDYHTDEKIGERLDGILSRLR